MDAHWIPVWLQAMGRQRAFNLAIAGWVPCGLLLAALSLTMRRDEVRFSTVI